MSYMHIENLYKLQTILMFRECFALEKIHGTSAHVSWRDGNLVRLSSGGMSGPVFAALFGKRTAGLFKARVSKLLPRTIEA